MKQGVGLLSQKKFSYNPLWIRIPPSMTPATAGSPSSAAWGPRDTGFEVKRSAWWFDAAGLIQDSAPIGFSVYGLDEGPQSRIRLKSRKTSGSRTFPFNSLPT